MDNRNNLKERDMNKAVVCSGVEKRFKKRGREPLFALRGIEFSVGKGEIFGIVGVNGSGKSTLIRILSTLLYPDSGTVRVFGHDVINDSLAVRRLINRVSVDAAFFKKLSAWENLSYAARLYGMRPKEAKKISRDILEGLGFEKMRIEDSVEDLSRGMQQKVAIARALMTSPILLLLDEPTTGLDPKSKRDVQSYVLNVRREHNATVLLTTHDMDEAEKMCDRVAIIDQGRFIALDTPGGLKEMISKNGATLEEVFIQLTGKEWEE
jgi:ABC-2 type transport system ATP-binding protein